MSGFEIGQKVEFLHGTRYEKRPVLVRSGTVLGVDSALLTEFQRGAHVDSEHGWVYPVHVGAGVVALVKPEDLRSAGTYLPDGRERRDLVEMIRAQLTGSMEPGDYDRELDEKCAALNSLVDMLVGEFEHLPSQVCTGTAVCMARRTFAKAALLDLATSLGIHVISLDEWIVPW